MSQAGTSSKNAPPPVNVPTKFETDKIDSATVALSAAVGEVIPQANKLRLGGDNGISTYEISQEAGSLTVGFIRGTGITTDVQTTPIITQAVPADSTMTLQIIAAGFGNNNDAAGLYGTAVVKNVGGTVSVVNTVDLIKNTDASLAASDLTVTASGSDFVISTVGVLGVVISWDVALPGIVVSS